MFNEPRNWKWMVPAMFMPVFGTVAAWLIEQTELYMQVIGMVIGIWAIVFLIAAIMNCWAYFSEIATDEFSSRQKALATTPQVLLSENMRQMHPSAISVLAMYGRTTWQVIPGKAPEDDSIYVLYGTQTTYEFIADFLLASTDQSCAPQWKFFNEGAKHYAPAGLEEGWCTDREQHQQLQAYFYGRLMTTMPFGNQPAAWIAPWNPKTVAKVMNINLEVEEKEMEQ